MNIKLRINGVVRLVDNRISMEQVHKQLVPLSLQAKLDFPLPQVGAGYLQWSLPGNDWVSFAKADEEQKALVAVEYADRLRSMHALLGASPLKEAILTVPSEEFIYFREAAAGYEISLVAWGYKYPNLPPCKELNTWVRRVAKQAVSIGFSWADNLLPRCGFRLEGLKHETADDGLFRVDGLLPVGKKYAVKSRSGCSFTLTVEQGNEKYVFDLTRYVQVDITVTEDDRPLPDCVCDVRFKDELHSVKTDASGGASLRLPLACNQHGELLQAQPACRVSCRSEEQEQTPAEGDVCTFHFAFHSEPVSPVPPVPPPLPLVPPEPKFVVIKLLDYGGQPMPDMEFVLTTRKKGAVSLKTDAEGVCQIPQEWLTNREKFKITMEVTPEYQAAHDLHDRKK